MNAIARPFGALLMFLYDLTGSYGLALMLLAVVVMLILLPFQMKAKPGQIRQGKLQPRLAELRKKHGDNKAKINEETQKIYKEEGINPLSGCLWGFLPLPILLVLFQVIRQPLTHMLGIPEEFLNHEAVISLFESLLPNGGWVMPAQWVQIEQAQLIGSHLAQFRELAAQYFPDLTINAINFEFFGMNLGNQPQWNFFMQDNWGAADVGLFLIPIISGAAQFINARINKKLNPAGAPEAAGGSMGMMMMLMPLLSVWFGFMFPAALGLYWTMQSIIRVGQDIWLTKRYTKIIDAEDADRRKERDKKEAEIEAKRIETERKRAEGLAAVNKNTSKRKMQMSDKRGQIERAAEWQKKNAPKVETEAYEPSREGNRKFARGRAYDPDRYFTGVSSRKRHAVSVDDEDYEEIYDDDDIVEEATTDVDEYDELSDANNDDFAEEYAREFEEEFAERFAAKHEEELEENTAELEVMQSDEAPPVSSEAEAPSTVRFETARFEDKREDD
jgi:YidC/Oxa1 family membrane protein insertase